MFCEPETKYLDYIFGPTMSFLALHEQEFRDMWPNQ